MKLTSRTVPYGENSSLMSWSCAFLRLHKTYKKSPCGQKSLLLVTILFDFQRGRRFVLPHLPIWPTKSLAVFESSTCPCRPMSGARGPTDRVVCVQEENGHDTARPCDLPDISYSSKMWGGRRRRRRSRSRSMGMRRRICCTVAGAHDLSCSGGNDLHSKGTVSLGINGRMPKKITPSPPTRAAGCIPVGRKGRPTMFRFFGVLTITAGKSLKYFKPSTFHWSKCDVIY